MYHNHTIEMVCISIESRIHKFFKSIAYIIACLKIKREGNKILYLYVDIARIGQ